MKAKEIIAIIGATGNIGSSIAANQSKENYRMILMGRDVKKSWLVTCRCVEAWTACC